MGLLRADLQIYLISLLFAQTIIFVNNFLYWS